MKNATLISFWIKTTESTGPVGFGVTARCFDDAVDLIEQAGYSLNLTTVTVFENVYPHEVDEAHIARNSGPSAFRGIWYPCLNIGWGANHR